MERNLARIAVFAPRAVVIASVLLLHVALVVALLSGARFSFQRTIDSVPIVAAFLDIAAQPDAIEVSVVDIDTTLKPEIIAVIEPVADIDVDEEPTPSASTGNSASALHSAPVLVPGLAIDPRPFAVQARLVGEQEAMIVLMIEVLADGHPGAIAVERSGGTGEIDTAAVDYARTLRWVPGRVGGIATTMTVRFGVHLKG